MGAWDVWSSTLKNEYDKLELKLLLLIVKGRFHYIVVSNFRYNSFAWIFSLFSFFSFFSLAVRATVTQYCTE